MNKSGQIHNAPNDKDALRKIWPDNSVNRVIFHAAQSGEVLVSFSPLLAAETTEKPAEPGSYIFLFLELNHKKERESLAGRSEKDPKRILFPWMMW